MTLKKSRSSRENLSIELKQNLLAPKRTQRRRLKKSRSCCSPHLLVENFKKNNLAFFRKNIEPFNSSLDIRNYLKFSKKRSKSMVRLKKMKIPKSDFYKKRAKSKIQSCDNSYWIYGQPKQRKPPVPKFYHPKKRAKEKKEGVSEADATEFRCKRKPSLPTLDWATLSRLAREEKRAKRMEEKRLKKLKEIENADFQVAKKKKPRYDFRSIIDIARMEQKLHRKAIENLEAERKKRIIEKMNSDRSKSTTIMRNALRSIKDKRTKSTRIRKKRRKKKKVVEVIEEESLSGGKKQASSGKKKSQKALEGHLRAGLVLLKIPKIGAMVIQEDESHLEIEEEEEYEEEEEQELLEFNMGKVDYRCPPPKPNENKHIIKEVIIEEPKILPQAITFTHKNSNVRDVEVNLKPMEKCFEDGFWLKEENSVPGCEDYDALVGDMMRWILSNGVNHIIKRDTRNRNTGNLPINRLKRRTILKRYSAFFGLNKGKE